MKRLHGIGVAMLGGVLIAAPVGVWAESAGSGGTAGSRTGSESDTGARP
jgi:hypothetical protein